MSSEQLRLASGAGNGTRWTEQAPHVAKRRSMADILQHAESRGNQSDRNLACQSETATAFLSSMWLSHTAAGGSFRQKPVAVGFAGCSRLDTSKLLPRTPFAGDVGRPGSLVKESFGEVESEWESRRKSAEGATQQFVSTISSNRHPSGCECVGGKTQASCGPLSGVTAVGGKDLAGGRPRKRQSPDDVNVTFGDGSEWDHYEVGPSVVEGGAQPKIEHANSLPTSNVRSDGGLKPSSVAFAAQGRSSNIVNLTETVKQIKKEAKEVERSYALWRERRQEGLDLQEAKLGFTTRQKELFREANKILEQVKRHRMSPPFLIPVDVVRYGLFDYYQIIKKPMDLGTIQCKLDAKGEAGYQDVRDLCDDIRLVFRNAMTYHGETTKIYKMAWTLSKCFEKKWSQLGRKVIDLEARLTRQILYEHSYEDVQNARSIAIRLFKQLDEAEGQIMILRGEAGLRFRIMVSEEKGNLHEVVGWLCDDEEKAPAVTLPLKKTAILDHIDQKNGGGITQVQKEAVVWSLYTALKRQSHCGEASSGASHSEIPAQNLPGLDLPNAKRPRSLHLVRPRTSFEGLWNSTEEDPDHDRCRINNGQYTYRCKGKVVPGFKTCLYHREKARQLQRRKAQERNLTRMSKELS